MGNTAESRTEGREIPQGKTPVIIAGLPGAVAQRLAEEIVRSENFTLDNFALGSDRHTGEEIDILGKKIRIHPPSEHADVLAFAPSNMIADIFSTPQAGTDNAELLAGLGISFVMGTTGIDRKRVEDAVKNSEANAVIAPNMSPHMVLLQAMFEDLAREFPGALRGSTGHIRERHQKEKKDVSGTAKAWGSKLSESGVIFDEIEPIRDSSERQAEHMLIITGQGGTPIVEIHTLIKGVDAYIPGIMMANSFLVGKMKQGEKGQVYSMTDVLKAQGNSTP